MAQRKTFLAIGLSKLLENPENDSFLNSEPYYGGKKQKKHKKKQGKIIIIQWQ